LRDFTDVKPLAGDTATDAIRDSVAQAPVQPPLPAPLPGPAPPAQSALALAALPGLRRGWSHSSDASNNSGLGWKTFQKRASQNRRMGIMVIHGDKL